MRGPLPNLQPYEGSRPSLQPWQHTPATVSVGTHAYHPAAGTNWELSRTVTRVDWFVRHSRPVARCDGACNPMQWSLQPYVMQVRLSLVA